MAIHGIHDGRQSEAGEVGGREAAIAIGAPLHGGANGVASAEKHIVAQAQLVAVVDDRRAGERKEEREKELEALAAVLDERREAAADAAVEPHRGIGCVLLK